MHKKSKLLVALTLVLVIGLTGITTALASEDPPEAGQREQAVIAKLLKTPFGTEIPAGMEFIFNVELMSINGSTNTALLDSAKNGLVTDEVTIAFDGTQKSMSSVNGIDTWVLESKGLFNIDGFRSPGAYEYKITEQAPSYSIANPNNEALVYSDAEYKVVVFVKYVDGKLQITYIGVTQTFDDEGEKTSNGEKLDPSPADPENPATHSALAFTNKYMRANGPEDPDKPNPTDPNASTLFISKNVTGDFGSTTQKFDFTLAITVPDLIEDFVKDTYKAYIVALQGTELVRVDSGYIEFDRKGIPETFSLSHNQRLVFVDTPVGTSYTVSEAATPNYRISAFVTRNGVTRADAVAESLSGGLMLPDGGNITSDWLFVGQTGSSATFTNDASGIQPMGIVMNNLPFIGLIALSLGGLIIFVVLKSRKNEDNA